MKKLVEIEVTVRMNFETTEDKPLSRKDFYERLTYPDLIRIVNHRIVKEEFIEK